VIGECRVTLLQFTVTSHPSSARVSPGRTSRLRAFGRAGFAKIPIALRSCRRVMLDAYHEDLWVERAARSIWASCRRA